MTWPGRLLLLASTLAASAALGLPRTEQDRPLVLLTVVDAPDAGSADAAPDASAAAAAPLDAGAADAGAAASSGEAADAGTVDPCAPLADRVERRRAWLKARREEQFALGGPPDPARGVPNAIGVWCEKNPGHEECALGGAVVDVTTEELAWSPEKTPEDYDGHVVMMKRAVKVCREKAAWRW